MPYARATDGVRLYYEEHGPAAPVDSSGGRRPGRSPRGRRRAGAAPLVLLAMDHITDELPRLSTHGISVLLVGGDRDPSLQPMRVMRRKIRGSRLVVLSPASHFANRDQPAAWNRTVLAFLDRVEGAPPHPTGGARRAGPDPARVRAGYSRIQLSASGISGTGAGPPLG